MAQTKLNWFVIGGWALDLFVGEKLREHKDVENSIWRVKAHLIFEYFRTNCHLWLFFVASDFKILKTNCHNKI